MIKDEVRKLVNLEEKIDKIFDIYNQNINENDRKFRITQINRTNDSAGEIV